MKPFPFGKLRITRFIVINGTFMINLINHDYISFRRIKKKMREPYMKT